MSGPTPTVHHQVLKLSIDLQNRVVQGVCKIWLHCAAPAADERPVCRLHARQMEITGVKVNGAAEEFEYPYPLDLLKDVAPPARQDGEAFDLYYRVRTTVSQEGELKVVLPAAGMDDEAKAALACKEGIPEANQVYELEVSYVLRDPSAGLRFQSHPLHVYSTARSLAPLDVDGPRCWFPCSDRPTDVCTFGLEVTVSDREASVLSGGQVLERDIADDKDEVTWRYAMATPVPAKCVSLVAGRFRRYVDPSSPLFTHYYLADHTDDTMDGGVVPKSWIAHSAGGLAPAVQFMADYFSLVTPPQHRIVYVKGCAEAVLPFHELSLHRHESLHPPALFDPSMTSHLHLVEGYLSSFLLPRLRPRFLRDAWALYAVLGYLLTHYVRKRYGEDEYRVRLLALRDASVALERNGYTQPLLPTESSLCNTEFFSPRHLSLLRVKAPLVMHMMEHHAGRKAVRDVLRKACSPPPPEGEEEGSGKAAADRLATDPRWTSQPVRSHTFIRSITGNSTTTDGNRGLRSRWLEGSGVANFHVTYLFKPEKKGSRAADKIQAEVIIIVRQVVPPWGRVFSGSIKVVVMEEEAPYPYEIEVKGTEPVIHTHKVRTKIVKQKQAPRRRPSSGPATGGEGGGDDQSVGPTPDGTQPKKKKRKKAAGPEPVPMDVSPTPAPTPTASAGEPKAEGEEEDEDEVGKARAMLGCPILYVTIDPDMQWIAEWEFDVDELLLVEHLRRENDAALQCVTLRHLARYPILEREMPASAALPTLDRKKLVLDAISDCLRGKVRKGCVTPPLLVRIEAARALSVWSNRHGPTSGVNSDRFAWPGLVDRLLSAFRERYFDRSGAVMLRNDFKDEADYQIKKAILAAVARVRGPDGTTPYVVWDTLRLVLASNDNTGNQFGDDYYVAHLLRCVSWLRMPPSIPYLEVPGDRATLVSALEEQVRGCLAYSLEVKSHDDVVPAAAIQALANLEIIRGGMPTFDYHKYASPKYSLRVRLAAMEAVARLGLLGEESDDDSDDSEGPIRVIEWTLAVLEREGPQGSLALKYWGLKTLFEALRRPMDFRAQSFTPILAQSSLVDHLDPTVPAMDLIDPAFSHLGTAYAPQPPVLDPNNPPPPPRAPPSAPKSSHNPFIQPLRLGSPCALSLRSKLWHWLNHSTWDCQPLRLLVSNLHQYLYGPDPPPPPEALAQPLQPLQQASDHSPQHDANPLSKQIRDLRGLKDAYMVLLELRQDGSMALRRSIFDDRDWRLGLPRAIADTAAAAATTGVVTAPKQPQGQQNRRGSGRVGEAFGQDLLAEDADEEEKNAERAAVHNRLGIAQKMRLRISVSVGGATAAKDTAKAGAMEGSPPGVKTEPGTAADA